MRVYGFANTTEGIIEIENSLEAEQKFVGGYIEVIGIGNGIDLVCNEEGKINCLQPTVAWIEDGKVVEIICGECFLCRHNDEGDFVSIKDEDIEYIQSKLFPVAEIIDKRICIAGR
uniref:DUF3846 domain-containing protein n=1 Tax=Acetatifactor sp. TaxID=1872090 RepID=UPI004057B7A0